MVCRIFFSPVIFPFYSGNVVEKRREATKKSYAFQVKATDWYNLLTERKKRLLVRNMEVVLLKRRTQPPEMFFRKTCS